MGRPEHGGDQCAGSRAVHQTPKPRRLDTFLNMTTPFTRRDFIKTTGTATPAATVLPAWAQAETKITVAFVGVAHIHTPGYLDLVKNHPGTQIKYVWDHDASRAARRAKEVDATVPADLNVIWSDPEISAV